MDCSSNRDVVPDCSGEDDVEPEGKLVDLPADLTFTCG